jgi:hypothetical protein
MQGFASAVLGLSFIFAGMCRWKKAGLGLVKV